MMDVEGTSDAFVRSFIDPDDDHLTDTHWRCQTGEASFNWRLIFPVKSQQDTYLLTIQAWDKDVIASNDLIGDFVLDFAPMFEDLRLTNKTQVFCKTYWNSYLKEELEKRGVENTNDIKFEDEENFWVPVRREVEGNMKKAGKIMCSFRIYPKAVADKNPQGKGRNEPNNDPVCPPPEGRLKLTLNPFAMFN